MSKEKNAIGYIRVSTDQQAERGSSLENQRERIEDFCKKNGMRLVEIFEDAGFSARSTNRPAFKEMMKYISDGKVDALVVWHSNRFARNLRDYVVNLYEIERRKVTFHSIEEPEFSGSSGKAMRNLLAVFAEYQSDLTGEQVRSVKGTLKKNKKVYCGFAPLGYKNKDGVLELQKSDMQIVEEVKTLRANGMSMNKIAKRLNAKGLRGNKGGKFHTSTIEKILKNNIYEIQARD